MSRLYYYKPLIKPYIMSSFRASVFAYFLLIILTVITRVVVNMVRWNNELDQAILEAMNLVIESSLSFLVLIAMLFVSFFLLSMVGSIYISKVQFHLNGFPVDKRNQVKRIFDPKKLIFEVFTNNLIVNNQSSDVFYQVTLPKRYLGKTLNTISFTGIKYDLNQSFMGKIMGYTAIKIPLDLQENEILCYRFLGRKKSEQVGNMYVQFKIKSNILYLKYLLLGAIIGSIIGFTWLFFFE